MIGIDTSFLVGLAVREEPAHQACWDLFEGETPEFWMNLQTAFDLEVAGRESKREIERDVHPREVA